MKVLSLFAELTARYVRAYAADLRDLWRFFRRHPSLCKCVRPFYYVAPPPGKSWRLIKIEGRLVVAFKECPLCSGWARPEGMSDAVRRLLQELERERGGV